MAHRESDHPKRGKSSSRAKADAKSPHPTGDEIAQTPEYKALLAEIVELIRNHQKRTGWRPKMTIRDLKKQPKPQKGDHGNAQ